MAADTVRGRDAVSDVMNACGCTEAQATSLLRHSNHDPEKAKLRHQTLLRFLKIASPVRRMSRIHNASTNRRTPIDSDAEDLSDCDSDREMPFHTSKTENEATPTSMSKSNLSQRSGSPSREARKAGKLDFLDGSSRPVTTTPGPSTPIPDYVQSQTLEDKLAAPTVQQIIITPDEQVEDKNSVLPEDAKGTSEWDFRLPLIATPSNLLSGLWDGRNEFNISYLVGALQQGASKHAIQNYLGYYNDSIIRRHINDTIYGVPAIFYAAATNDDFVIRTWIAYGGNVNAVHVPSRVPLVAFAIVYSAIIQTDTTNTVATLLSLGASPFAIPTAFYSPYCQDLGEDGPDDESLKLSDDGTSSWLTKIVRTKLAVTMNLTHRYSLHRASKIQQPSMRHWQVAKRRNAEALLGLPYFLIGQSMAANRVLQTFISHLANPTKQPLVLTFAGPSGHGKTELARRLGGLLSLELEVVDCTIVNREIELFGGRHPYVNADHGTPLNNFLARHSGQRSIVFLDEFEKTTKEIHQTLLLPFDSGEYQDRRNRNTIDCSKTIWILATNALDATISKFCKDNEQDIFSDKDESKKLHLLKGLERNLKEEFLSKFGAPITGRISAFLPFLRFSPDEQAVIAHKYLLGLAMEVGNPVNLKSGPDERLIGDIRLRIRRDASACCSIAEDGYHPELGARSLITAVDSVRSSLIHTYLGVDELIKEADGLTDFVVDVNNGEIVANMSRLEAHRMDEYA